MAQYKALRARFKKQLLRGNLKISRNGICIFKRRDNMLEEKLSLSNLKGLLTRIEKKPDEIREFIASYAVDFISTSDEFICKQEEHKYLCTYDGCGHRFSARFQHLKLYAIRAEELNKP